MTSQSRRIAIILILTDRDYCQTRIKDSSFKLICHKYLTINLQNIPPNRPPNYRKRRGFLILFVILLVAIVISASAAVSLFKHPHNVDVLSASEINEFVGQRLVEGNVSHSPAYSVNSSATELEAKIFNTTNGTGYLFVESAKFANQTQSRIFFTNSYYIQVANLNEYNITNKSEKGTFEGFKFDLTIYDQGTFYILVSAGYDGPFSFFIYDSGINVTNATVLVYEEIKSMS